MISRRIPMGVSLFPRGISLHARFVMCGVLSLGLMVFDHQTPYFSMIRTVVVTALHPLYEMNQWPGRLVATVYALWGDRMRQWTEREALQTENQTLRLRTYQLEAVRAENNRLRALLRAKPRLAEQVAVADVIAFNPDPFVHELTINKGQAEGVWVGQVVLDANGLIGQVIETAWHASVVLLITDAAHAVPVENQRTHARALVSGTGGADLQLLHVTSTADVQVGDRLLSSALGGRFPEGYPVGVVESITQDTGQPFLKIRVRAVAEPNKAHQVLLLAWGSGDPVAPVPPFPGDQPVEIPAAERTP